MSDDNVIDFSQKLDDLFKVSGHPAAEGVAASPDQQAAGIPGGGDETILPFDKLSHFPRVSDPYERAFPTPVRASLPMLVLLLKDGARPTFCYSDLRFMDVIEPKKPGDAPGLLLQFMGIGTVELEGIGLDEMHGYLYLHRLAWLREWPGGRKTRDINGVVISSIKVTLRES